MSGKEPKILDIAEAMPDMHETHAAGRGLHSVTRGEVYWDRDQNTAVCRQHGAMNCVSEDRHVWRCLAQNCGAGLYLVDPQTYKKRDPSDVDLAVQAERTLWENAILYAARRAEVDYLQLSAGQVLTKMADELCRLKGLGPYRNEPKDE